VRTKIYLTGLFKWIIQTDYSNGLFKQIIQADYSNGYLA